MELLTAVSKTQDDRRRITHLLRSDVKDINFYEAKKGAILGNHFHTHTNEYFFITKGSCIVTCGKKKQIAMKNSLFLIKSHIPHSIECVTDLNFLTFLSEPYDYGNPDIHK